MSRARWRLWGVVAAVYALLFAATLFVLSLAAGAAECCQGGQEGQLDGSGPSLLAGLIALGALVALGGLLGPPPAAAAAEAVAAAPALVLAAWAATAIEIKGPVEIGELLWFLSPAALLLLAAWVAYRAPAPG